jgi:hypothetical protein
MSHTDTLLTNGGTIPELVGILRMDDDEKAYLTEVISGFGVHGKKGFDFGIAALGILANRRKPLINEKTDEHIPFIFEPYDDKDGSFKGFKYGLEILSAVLNIEVYPDAIDVVGETIDICAEHNDSDLIMVSGLIIPSKNNRLDLNLRESHNLIAAFAIMHDDGTPLGVTLPKESLL